VLEGKDKEAEDRSNQTSDDDEVDIVGRDESVPVSSEIAEDGQLVEIDEVDKFYVCIELNSKDISIEEERNNTSVDDVGNKNSPKNKGIFFGNRIRPKQILGDDSDQDG